MRRVKPPAAPQDDATEDSRRKLIDAAIRLFSTHGLDGVTVRNIADEAGISFGLIRYHFGSKEGLYRACIERYGKLRLHSAKRFLQNPTSREDFTSKLRYAIEDILAIQLEDPPLTRLVLREAEAEESIADDVFRATLIEMAQSFVAFFRAAKQAGILREDADPLFTTHALQGIINHFVRTDAVRKRHFQYSLTDEKTKQQLIDQLHRFVLQGILAD
jgi:AcrR family transcriptional regulator